MAARALATNAIYPNGLCTLAAKAIDLITFGLAKPAAMAVARIFGGKTCGCDARRRAFNELVPDVAKVNKASWIWLAPKILKCLGVKENLPGVSSV